MAYMLAMIVGLGSFGLYMSAFFFPEVHRKYDLVWSGVGLFYALVLWICAGRITGGVLLGQMSSVALLGWFSWQNLQLRRDRTPLDQQTQLPDSIKTPNDAITVGRQTLKSLFNRAVQPTSTSAPSTATLAATSTEPITKPARLKRPATSETKQSSSRSTKPETISPTSPTTSEPFWADRTGRNTPKNTTPASSASKSEPAFESSPAHTLPDHHRETPLNPLETTPRLTPTAGTPIPSAEPQEWDEGGEWETAELPLEDALGRFNPEILNSLLEDTPSEPPVSESDPIYLRAELLSEPKEPDSASRSGRRRGRRSRSTSARQMGIPSPYSTGDDLEDEAIAFGETSPSSFGRPKTEQRSSRRRRSPSTLSDRDLLSFSDATAKEPTVEAKPGISPIPLSAPSNRQATKSNAPEDAIEEELTAPGDLDPNPAPREPPSDTDSDDWF